MKILKSFVIIIIFFMKDFDKSLQFSINYGSHNKF